MVNIIVITAQNFMINAAVTLMLINNMNYDVCIYVCFIALSLYPHSVRCNGLNI